MQELLADVRNLSGRGAESLQATSLSLPECTDPGLFSTGGGLGSIDRAQHRTRQDRDAKLAELSLVPVCRRVRSDNASTHTGR
jgi:hypothetical protein